MTVCHLLGNGGYHLLTMDDNALSAHLRHGDVYPDADGGCPPAAESEQPEPSQDGTSSEDTDQSSTSTDETVTEQNATDQTMTDEAGTTDSESPSRAVVAGVEAFGRAGAGSGGEAGAPGGQVAGAGANRAAPVAGPMAGILPQTGAARMLSGALVAGLGLLAGGAAVVTRRRHGAV